jgi:protein O-GlcNAc transferase
LLSRIGAFTIAALLTGTCCAHSTETSGAFESAVALRADGKGREAVKAFRRILVESPGHVKALVQLGAALQDQGAWREAETAYRTALGIDPANASARRNLDHLVSSKLLFSSKTDRSPSQRFLIERGLSAMKDRKFHDALMTFRVLSALSPGESDWVFYSARALEGLARHREAADLYEMILKSEPTYAAAWVSLIVSFIELGRKDQAAHLTESALSAIPNDHRIRWLARRLGIKPLRQSSGRKAQTRSTTNTK